MKRRNFLQAAVSAAISPSFSSQAANTEATLLDSGLPRVIDQPYSAILEQMRKIGGTFVFGGVHFPVQETQLPNRAAQTLTFFVIFQVERSDKTKILYTFAGDEAKAKTWGDWRLTLVATSDQGFDRSRMEYATGAVLPIEGPLCRLTHQKLPIDMRAQNDKTVRVFPVVILADTKIQVDPDSLRPNKIHKNNLGSLIEEPENFTGDIRRPKKLRQGYVVIQDLQTMKWGFGLMKSLDGRNPKNQFCLMMYGEASTTNPQDFSRIIGPSFRHDNNALPDMPRPS